MIRLTCADCLNLSNNHASPIFLCSNCFPGAYDDPNGSHISIQVVSDKFEGKRAVQRQQLVYKAIWEELQGPVHAVDSMICKTPDEA
jgi:stress-induced morphogen